MNEKTFYLNNIPFVPLSRRGRAVNCRIGKSKQLVFIPETYFNKNLTLKDDVNLEWFMRKTTIKHKIDLYKEFLSKGR